MKPRWWIVSVQRDTRMSMDARGLLIFLGTQPSGWRYNVDECRRYTRFGRNKHFEAMNEIEAAGYIAREYKRNKRGRIIYTRLTIADTPSPESRKQGHGKAAAEVPIYKTLPDSRKQGQASSFDGDAMKEEEAAPLRVIEGGKKTDSEGFAEKRSNKK